MKDQFNQEDKTLEVQAEVVAAQPKATPPSLGK